MQSFLHICKSFKICRYVNNFKVPPKQGKISQVLQLTEMKRLFALAINKHFVINIITIDV